MVKAADVALRFRDGLPEDARRISDLGRLTFAEFFGRVYKKADLDAYLERYFNPERVCKDLENPEIDYRIASSSSGLVGYSKLGPTTLPLTRNTDRILQMHRLYVREARQGVGVGSILLSWAIEQAADRGAEELVLGVWKQNESAIKLYQNRGFEIEGEYEIEVGSATDFETIMTLKLTK